MASSPATPAFHSFRGNACVEGRTRNRPEPGRARVHYNHGLLLQGVGRIDEAERALLHAIRIEPDNVEFLLGAGDHYLNRRRYTEARQPARRFTRPSPELGVGHEILRYLDQVSPGR